MKTNPVDPYSGPVPPLLLTVGLFLVAESLTFTTLAPRSTGSHPVDLLDFCFVFLSAVVITWLGVYEGHRLRVPPSRLWAAGVVGAVLGIAAGWIAVWFSGIGR